jgi:hypothetical protein
MAHAVQKDINYGGLSKEYVLHPLEPIQECRVKPGIFGVLYKV